MKKFLLLVLLAFLMPLSGMAEDLSLTFNRTSATAVTVNASGINGVQATLLSRSHSFMTSVASSIVCPAVNGNTSPNIVLEFSVTGLPANFRYNSIGLNIHALNSSGGYQMHDNVNRQWNVSISTGQSNTALSPFASMTNIDIAAEADIVNGKTFKIWNFDSNQPVESTNPLIIRISVTKGEANEGCFFGLEGITLSQAAESRNVTVNVAEESEGLGSVAIISPATDELSLNVAGGVTVKATPANDDVYFVNWTDAAGNVISESAEFTYTSNNPVTLSANFRQYFIVTIDDPENGTMVRDEQNRVIASGSRVDKGTQLNVRCAVRGKELGALLINDVNVIDQYNNGYTFTVDGPVVIAPAYQAPKFTLSIAIEGEGTVIVTDEINDEGAPAGEIFADGAELEDNECYFVIATPAAGMKLESLTVGDETPVVDYVVNDDEYTTVYGDTVVFEYYVFGVTKVIAKFVVDESAIEMIGVDAANAAEFYSLQGVRIDAQNLTPGLYILRDTQGARKVVIK